MKKTKLTLTRFDFTEPKRKGFYVEITPNEKEKSFEFVLCKERYAYKSYMFGLLMKDAPEEMWEHIIEGNIDDYIEVYSYEVECFEAAFV